MQYLISIYQPDGEPPPPEILNPIMARLRVWGDQLKSTGSWVFSAGLRPPSTATVLRATGDDIVVTDGPFAEGKEHLGGFTIISAADLDAAIHWAGEVAQITSLPIEVRPIQASDAG